MAGRFGIEIIVDAPRRTLRPQQYMKVLVETRAALEDVDKAALPGRQPRLDWVIEEATVNGVHRAVIVPRTIPARRTEDTVRTTSVGLVTGVDRLHQTPEIPPLFFSSTVERVTQIGSSLGDRFAAVHVKSQAGGEAVVDVITVAHAKEATHVARHAFGSVEGRLDVLVRSAGGGIRALVVDERTRRAVSVQAAPDAMEDLRQAWGGRVRVAGKLVRNAAGQAIRVEMTGLTSLPEREQVSAWELLGAAPDFTGDLSTEEFLQQARRG